MSLPEFAHPFTCVVSGPTQAGKTELVKNILIHIDKMLYPVPTRIVWYYSESQPKLELELPHVEFRNELPSMDDFDGVEPTVVVIDDFMSETNTQITKLFSKGSHHKNLSIFFLVQNFYHHNKEMRSITLNAQYIIAFRNPRDRSQILFLSRQMFPGNSKFLVDSFNDATSLPHGYLVIDLKQRSPEHLRIRTNILPHQDTIVYTDKKFKPQPVYENFNATEETFMPKYRTFGAKRRRL